MRIRCPEKVVVPLITILSLLLQGGVSGHFEDIQQYGDQKAAVKACNQLNSTLPYLEDASHEEQLISYLQNKNINETWLPIKRLWFAAYQWLDQTDLEDSKAFLGERLGHACGVIDLTLGMNDFLPCETEKLSCLCQLEGCPSCHSRGRTDQTCITMNNTCYILVCGATNWFTGKSLCQEMGGSLAVIKNQQGVYTMKELWKDGSSLDSCSLSWIGLRREDWTMPVQHLVHWDQHEPSKGKNCSIFHRNGVRYYVKSAACEEEHIIICDKGQFIQSGTKSASPSPSLDDISKSFHPENIIMLVTGIFIGTFLGIALCATAVLRRKNSNARLRKNRTGKKKKKRNKEDTC